MLGSNLRTYIEQLRDDIDRCSDSYPEWSNRPPSIPEHIEEYMKAILLNKQYFFRDDRLHEILHQFSSILEQQNTDMVCNLEQTDLILPLVKALNALGQHNEKACISMYHERSLRLGVFSILQNRRAPSQVVHQCIELVQSMLKIKEIRDEFSLDEVVAIVDSLTWYGRLYKHSKHQSHLLEDRSLVALLLCFDYLCFCRKFQAMSRVYPKLCMNTFDVVVTLLSNCNETSILHSSLKVLDYMFGIDILPIKEQNIDHIFVRLLGSTNPDIVFLSGKLLIKYSEHNKLRLEENGTFHHCIISLFCKNVIIQTQSSGDSQVSEAFMIASCEIIVDIIAQSDGAKGIISMLLREIDESLERNGHIQLHNPVEQMRKIREKVRNDPAMFRKIIEVYNHSIQQCWSHDST